MSNQNQVLTVDIDYNPLPTQERFHKSLAKYRLYRGALGAGKTVAGCYESLFLSLEEPNNLGIIARQTYQELEDTTMRTFFQICPSVLIRYWNAHSRRLILYNNSEILFRSLDNPDKFKSLEIGFFYIDEASETTEEMFWTLAGRLRKPGIKRLCGILTSNPVNVTHWLYKLFVENKSEDFEEFHASTYENKENLPEGYIEALEKNYPASWVNKYLKGNWGFTSEGQPVFTNFREDIHVRDLVYLREEPLYVGLDFGFRKPCALFTQIDEKKRWLILKELSPENITAYDFAKMVVDFINKNFPYVSDIYFYGDPACDQKSDKNERTTKEIFMQYKIREKPIIIRTRRSSIVSRIEIIQRKLQGNPTGPELLIDRRCIGLIDALAGGYHYKENTDEPEKDNFFDHYVDALGYIAVNLFSHYNFDLLSQEVKPIRIGNWRYR